MRTRRQVLALAFAAAAAVATVSLSAHAQVLRNIPATAPAAQLTVNSANTGTLSTGSTGLVRILLLGFGSSSADIRFAPGVRILSLDGRLLPPGSVVGQTFKVRYQLDLYQQLLTAWVVSDEDYKAAVAAQAQSQSQ
ncbi:hypothetical protein R82526_02022 [Ralstonia mannitolilytica]|uniref:hypothetical protein n=1 Tax=Ralstonia mannitolilytica TaxID=105219 RepID=UPI0007AFF2C2|nr:hypothetical protein [Ralstonia mannitolilytica]ATG20740.1 hypothetical protein CO705_13130 [Ralstonia pickettii]ANA33975.1 hypothetical protein VZ52_11460 [Ralstonia mannitolilytica]CAJ0682981.1 hypothetical protein R82526_02022 [Ralstonia mannitolilytica]CAJ0850035.1 hypothetical protein R76727_00366 [Ralstonia mannitolilytica]CAJ0868631.1 hypothetical protein R1479_01533 [Ralstonia mannitolilytica]